jgi:two-component system OmpR family sensor kinase
MATRSGSEPGWDRRQYSRPARARLLRRAGIAAAVVAVLAGTWYGLAAALLPQPPVPREILFGAGVAILVMFALIGCLAIIEARALRRAEDRMRRFLADASHELRTPIAGVLASAETLLRSSPDRAGREKLVLQILHEAHRAGRLVDDLLTMTRLEQSAMLRSSELDLVPLTAAAVELTRELAPALDIQLDAPASSLLHGDPEGIRQVLDNVLSNARHATPPGGRVIVLISNLSAEVRIEVTDTGPGVPAADRERIFERFTRLAGQSAGAPAGNGLGLAIARSIASAHSGSLTCADPDGAGARFVLRLPRSR